MRAWGERSGAGLAPRRLPGALRGLGVSRRSVAEQTAGRPAARSGRATRGERDGGAPVVGGSGIPVRRSGCRGAAEAERKVARSGGPGWSEGEGFPPQDQRA